MNIDSNIVYILFKHLDNVTDEVEPYHHHRVIDFYNAARHEQKQIIDSTVAIFCGYTLQQLITQSETGINLDDLEDDDED